MPAQARRGAIQGDEEYSDFGDLLELLTARPPWHADALCQEHPEVTWFPLRGETVEPAKDICRRCLVRGECQTWAMAHGPELKGVWGGLSENDRRRLREGQRAA